MSSTVEGDLAEGVIATLRSMESELKRDGIARLWLFGSVARGEAHAGSDVDLAALLKPDTKVSLVDLAGIELRLGEVFGRPVDLLTLPIKNPWVKANVERDTRHVF